MSDWRFDYHEVLVDEHGRWWHVVDRLESVDGDGRMYRLYDGTHTADDYIRARYVEGDATEEPEFAAAGFTTDTKPAHEHGFRVNGVLCEPAHVERWLGTDCRSDHDCPHCGEPTTQAADIVAYLENQEVQSVEIRCGACGETNEVENHD